MAKGTKTLFYCKECGNESSKWLGQCPVCHEWNTFVEAEVTKSSQKVEKALMERKPSHLSEIQMEEEKRISTHMEEMDRVLGGGIVRGSLVLVGGDPGIGKSTLLLQTCHRLCADDLSLLYISGEESLQQIRMRADRIGEFNDHLALLAETNLEIIDGVIRKEKPDIVIIDSIQTMYSDGVDSALGSVSHSEGVYRNADETRQGTGGYGFRCRSCDQGRDCGGA